jgi:tetratricopeptide (TPR) repeat protein
MRATQIGRKLAEADATGGRKLTRRRLSLQKVQVNLVTAELCYFTNDDGVDHHNSQSTAAPAINGSLAYPRSCTLLLFVLVVSLYLPSTKFGFIYDDGLVILDQKAVKSLSDVARIFSEPHYDPLPYYRPVTRTLLLLQKGIHGDNAAPFHLGNAILAGVVACLAFGLLSLPAFRIRPIVALSLSVLFAVHPVASSCVYPIASGRETLLPACFILAAMFAFLRGGRMWYVIAITCFALSLFSKEQAVIVPVLFVLADVLKISPDSPIDTVGGWVRRYSPIVLLMCVYVSIRWAIFGGTEYTFAVLEKPTGPLLSFGYAFQTTLAPSTPLVYEPTIEIWPSAFRLALSGLAIVALIAATVRMRSSLGRIGLFWCGWFLICLLPTANLIEQEASFAERYVFLATLGAIGLAGAVLSVPLDWNRWWRRGIVGAILLLSVAAAGVSWHRGQYFQDEISFYGQWVRTNPRLAKVQYFLASALFEEGKLIQAIPHYREALRITSGSPLPTVADLKSHYELASVLSDLNRTEESIHHYQCAIRIDRTMVPAHYYLARELAKLERSEEAIEHFRFVIRNYRDYAQAHCYLANELGKLGQDKEAIDHYREAIRIDPNSWVPHFDLGNLFLKHGERELGLQHLRQAEWLKQNGGLELPPLP